MFVDGILVTPPANWPPLVNYVLRSAPPSPEAQPFVRTGNPRRYVLEFPYLSGNSYSGPVAPDLNHSIFSELLGQPEATMDWAADSQITLHWSNRANLRSEVVKAIQQSALPSTAPSPLSSHAASCCQTKPAPPVRCSGST